MRDRLAARRAFAVPPSSLTGFRPGLPGLRPSCRIGTLDLVGRRRPDGGNHAIELLSDLHGSFNGSRITRDASHDVHVVALRDLDAMAELLCRAKGARASEDAGRVREIAAARSAER